MDAEHTTEHPSPGHPGPGTVGQGPGGAHSAGPGGSEGLTLDLAQQIAEIRVTLAEIQHDLAEGRRQAREMQDLKDDLTRVARDVLESAVREMDDLTPFVRTGDFGNLVKKLLRNTNRIAEGFDKLESAADFVRDATPITHDAFRAAIAKLDELERKGYFQVARDLQSTTDAFVRLLGAWGVLPALRATLEHAASQGPSGVERYSLWRAYRATRRPDMRYLLGAAVGLVGRFAAELRLGQRRAVIDVAGQPMAALAEQEPQGPQRPRA